MSKPLPALEQALARRKQGVQHFEPETELMLLMHDMNLNQGQAALLLVKEANALITQSTIGRMLRGEAKPSLTALAIFALERIQQDREHPTDLHRDYQGAQSFGDENTEHTTHFVSAHSPEEAIKKLVAIGFDLAPTRNETDYDCTGMWYRSSPQVDYIVSRNCYAVTTTLTLDV